MRVLYLCHRIPYPPNKGEKIRAFHELKVMGKSCEVDLFTLADRKEDLSYKSDLEAYCRTVTVAKLSKPLAGLRAVPSVLRGDPLTLPYFYSADLALKVRQALCRRSYDLIFIYSSSMAQYVDPEDRIPILIDLVDVDSDKWLQYSMRSAFPRSVVFWREAECLRRYERKISEKASCVLVTTEREARVLREITNSVNVRVMPNGVDTNYFAPAVTEPQAAQPTLIFTGSMDYFPNVDGVEFFASRILPSIRKAVPNAQFLIVGSRPSRSVRRLAKLPGVQVTGSVPDVRPYLARSHVFVAPLLIASGTQNKILEAMAMALPVIATPRAIQGLPAALRDPVQVAESTQAWVAKTCHVLRDRSFAQLLGTASRQKVVDECSWDTHLNGLMDLIQNPEGREESNAIASLCHGYLASGQVKGTK
jgi:sugar transferase (PEP-CTERM/EpsH1 system associated)